MFSTRQEAKFDLANLVVMAHLLKQGLLDYGAQKRESQHNLLGLRRCPSVEKKPAGWGWDALMLLVWSGNGGEKKPILNSSKWL